MLVQTVYHEFTMLGFVTGRILESMRYLVTYDEASPEQPFYGAYWYDEGIATWVAGAATLLYTTDTYRVIRRDGAYLILQPYDYEFCQVAGIKMRLYQTVQSGSLARPYIRTSRHGDGAALSKGAARIAQALSVDPMYAPFIAQALACSDNIGLYGAGHRDAVPF